MSSSFFPGATQPVVNGGTLQSANDLFIYNDHRSAVVASSDALASAKQQYDLVKGNKKRCKILIQRCQDLVDAVSNQIQRGGLPELMQDNIHILANVCISVKDIVTNLASQPFAWRLLNQDKTDGELKVAESNLLHAISIFNFSAQVDSTRLQREIANSIAEAAATDHAELISHLNDLSQNDYKILHSLQENHIRTEELLIALTKHVQNIQFSTTPSGKFMRNAVGALQRLSKAPITTVSVWQLTSLEVTFNRDDVNSQVGQGSFGTVFKGLWHGEVVAVKEMYIEDARSIDRNVLKSVHNEIAIWSRLSHPRMVQFYGACLEATRPFLVSRFCQNGNILDYLRKNPSKDRLKLMHGISVGMLYLHNQSIIHADLKGANILIDHDGTALISDFGISQLKDQAGTSSLNGTGKEKTKGTLRWMAPELMEGEKLNFPVDVYSFGITAWEVYTLEVPFSDIPERAFYRRVIDKQERPKCPPTMDSNLIDLVVRCWAHEAAERPTFKSLSSSIWTMLASVRSKETPTRVEEEKHERALSGRMSRTPVADPTGIDVTRTAIKRDLDALYKPIQNEQAANKQDIEAVDMKAKGEELLGHWLGAQSRVKTISTMERDQEENYSPIQSEDGEIYSPTHSEPAANERPGSWINQDLLGKWLETQQISRKRELKEGTPTADSNPYKFEPNEDKDEETANRMAREAAEAKYRAAKANTSTGFSSRNDVMDQIKTRGYASPGTEMPQKPLLTSNHPPRNPYGRRS